MADMDNEQIDTAVAEKIMGWEPVTASGYKLSSGRCWLVNGGTRGEAVRESWSPTTNPSHDYEVLVKVREEWDAEKQWVFALAIIALHPPCDDGKPRVVQYKPGDYAKAALAAIGD